MSVSDRISADADLISLRVPPDAVDDAIVTRLADRLQRGEPYSQLGRTLITLNPFRVIPALVSPALISQYFSGASMLLKPHPFAIAARALIDSSQRPQAIVCGGESGSGKTECARLLVAAVAYASRIEPKAAATADRLQAANLALEAFGNAKTLRNDNSSRFAKWTDLTLSPAGLLRGARCEVYLLDRSKVLDRAWPYHALRYLAAAPADFRSSIRLPPATATLVTGASDAASFRGLDSVLHRLGVADTLPLWRALSLVQNLLDLSFEESESGAAKLVETASVGAICALLSCESAALRAAITTRVLIVKGEQLLHDCDVREAADAAASVAKHVYVRLFDTVVSLINTSVAAPEGSDERALGILDVFGFEGSEEAPGSFSTLAINTANESLHALFVSTVLREEVQLTLSEGVPFTAPEIVGNDDVRAMLETTKPSCWSIIDDATKINDGGLGGSLCETLNRRVRSSSLKVGNDHLSFIVLHTAASVTYSVEGLSSANADRYPLGFESLLASSPLQIGTTVPGRDSGRTGARPDAKKTSKGQTLGEIFRTSLAALVSVLSERKCHFIRCIIPNRGKKPLNVDTAVLLQQVRYLALKAAHAVTAEGYAFNAPLGEFYGRYRILTTKSWAHGAPQVMDDALLRSSVAALLGAALIPTTSTSGSGIDVAARARALGVSLRNSLLPCDIAAAGTRLAAGGFAVGVSRVFIRDGATIEGLEFARQLALHSVMSRLQVAFRSSAARAKLHAQLAAFVRLQAVSRGWFARQRLRKLRIAATRVAAAVRGRRARVAHAAEREALGIVRSAHGKVRRTESLAWPQPPLPQRTYLPGGVDIEALANALPHLGFTHQSRPVFADIVVKVRPRGRGATFMQLRGFIISSSHVVTFDHPISAHHPRVRSAIALRDITYVPSDR
jgi:myosin-5